MSSEVRPSKRDMRGLPAEMWTLPENVKLSEGFELMYTELCEQARDELRIKGTLGPIEEMLIERTVFLYVWIRNKESTDGFDHERNHKEINQLWQSFASQLKKSDGLDPEKIRDQMREEVSNTLRGILQDLPPHIANTVRPVMKAHVAKSDL